MRFSLYLTAPGRLLFRIDSESVDFHAADLALNIWLGGKANHKREEAAGRPRNFAHQEQ